jgi:hypothetical protein
MIGLAAYPFRLPRLRRFCERERFSFVPFVPFVVKIIFLCVLRALGGEKTPNRACGVPVPKIL